MLTHTNPFAFYNELTPFNDFIHLTNATHFQKVPGDWTLVLSDVKGSTKAISEGRYKQVNLIGAATITTYINVAQTSHIPFVFGGDGATLLVPTSLSAKLLEELRRLKRLSEEEFGLELRIAAITVDAINQMGHEIFISKFELSRNNYLAQFKGGGLTFAEALMKSGDPKIQILERAHDELYQSGEQILKGLTCRLTPLRSLRGEMMTVLCKPLGAKDQQEKVLHDLIQKFNLIFDKNLSTASPSNESNTSWPLIPKNISTEARLNLSGPYLIKWLQAALYSLISNLSLNLNFPLGDFKPEKYKKELLINSDSKKYDETLRMVLDCSPKEIETIISTLEKMNAEGTMAFGIHKSPEALMTCVCYAPSNNEHVHFIDGSNGGYAMAAIQLKKQLKG